MSKTKQININIPEELYKEVKHLSIDHDMSMKEILISALKTYIQELKSEIKLNVDGEEFIIEPTTEEDKPILEQARKDIAKGEYVEITDEEELDNEIPLQVKPAGISETSYITAQKLLQSELIGLWKDREDISDSADYARQLREQAQRRRT